MKLKRQTHPLTNPSVVQGQPDPSRSFLFDIETTGLSPQNSFIYLIGILFYQDHSWHSLQWLAEEESEEPLILEQFFSFCRSYGTLIHFNGRRFDLPFVLERCRHLQILCPLSGFSEFDLYQAIRPLKRLLPLEKLNQRYLEQFLGITRSDPYTGKELIRVYRMYQKHHSPESENAFFLHNLEDLTGMVSLFSFLPCLALKEGNFTFKRVLPIQDLPNGFFLKVSVSLPYCLAFPVSFQNSYGHFSAHDTECHFLISGRKTTMKHFFPDYKQYEYLLFEEHVIHKSLASYVERSHRRPAKPEECYVEKSGLFFPQKQSFYMPSFQESYHASDVFFEYDPKIETDHELLLSYIRNLFLE